MSTSNNPGAQVYTQGTGSASLSALGIVPIVSPVFPGSSNVQGPSGPFKIGQLWVDSTAKEAFILAGLSSLGGQVTAVWEQLSSGTGLLEGLITQDSATVTPTAGFININGASGQFQTTGSGHTVTISYANPTATPGDMSVNGSLATDGYSQSSGTFIVDNSLNQFSVTASSFTVFTGAGVINLGTDDANTQIQLGSSVSGFKSVILSNAVSGSSVIALAPVQIRNDLNFNIASSKLFVETTTPAANMMGTATLSGGIVLVTTTSVTASSVIFLSCNTPAGSQGILSAPSASIIAGVSFVINSSDIGDDSTVNYWIIN